MRPIDCQAHRGNGRCTLHRAHDALHGRRRARRARAVAVLDARHPGDLGGARGGLDCGAVIRIVVDLDSDDEKAVIRSLRARSKRLGRDHGLACRSVAIEAKE